MIRKYHTDQICRKKEPEFALLVSATAQERQEAFEPHVQFFIYENAYMRSAVEARNNDIFAK